MARGRRGFMHFGSIRRQCAGTGPFLLIWIALSQPLWAQRITGDIIGTITDTSGGAIPKEKVTPLNLDTGRLLEASATETGDYSFVELKPGRYEVVAESSG